jgi:hypothetical protein
MAKSNFERLLMAKESTFRVPPGGAYQDLRFDTHSLAQTTTTTASNEIQSNRMKTDVARTGVSAGGDIPSALSYSSQDIHLEAIMHNDFTAPQAISGTDISFTINSIDSVSTDFIAAGVQVGSWLRIKNSPGNTGALAYVRVDAVAQFSLTVPNTMIIEVAGAAIELENNGYLATGLVRESYTIESEMTDEVNVFNQFPGQVGSQFAISLGTEALTSFTPTYMGTVQVPQVITDAGSIVAAPTTRLMNTVDHVKNMWIDNTLVTGCLVNSFSVTYNNGLTEKKALGVLGACDITLGGVSVTGNIVLYAPAVSQIAKYLSFVDTSSAFHLEDSDGQGYIFDIHQSNYTTGSTPNSGLDNDLETSLDFEAKANAVTGQMFGITRFAAP